MNREHRIGLAEFDTAMSRTVLDPGQQAELAEFVKTDLLRVIDQVFDEIAPATDDTVPDLRLDQLEIDLGEIDVGEYRRQMPQRLRRRLRQALDLARVTAASGGSPVAGAAGDDSAPRGGNGDDRVLAHYLRHGYLPRDAASADAAALETQLRRIVESGSERLSALFGGTAPRAPMIARLRAQFPRSLAERALRLLESPRSCAGVDAAASGTAPAPAQVIELRPAQLEAALAAASRLRFDELWRKLQRDDRTARRSLLREIGGRAIQRQRLARRLSPRQFAELVRTFEPDAPGAMLLLLQPGHWLARLARQSPAASAAGEFRLREMLLGYLLVERGSKTGAPALAESLLNQLTASASRDRVELGAGLRDALAAAARSGSDSGKLARLMLSRVDEVIARAGRAVPGASSDGDARAPVGWPDHYRRYARLKAIFARAPGGRVEASSPADIDALAQQAPWLLLRLLRELQAAGDAWRRAPRDLDAPILEALNYRLATLVRQTAAPDSSALPVELIAAMRRNLARARSPRVYHREILSCLIRGDAIDFDRICAAEEAGGGDLPEETSVFADVFDETRAAREAAGANLPARGPRAAQLVQAAELLTTAAISAAPALPTARLQSIKWRLIRAWADESGPVFELERFARGFVAALGDAAGVGEVRDFYAALGQALLHNNLPETRAATRRLIELLDRIVAEIGPDPAAGRAEAVDDEIATADSPFDEIRPDEEIHIANAGLALLAPWLPRLFARLGFLDDGVFRDRDAAERAVHCLQFLVDRSVSSPEYQLVLNKILCGIARGVPIRRGIELSDDERKQLESLLEAVTRHWKALNNTSIDGLRESFLQRAGCLQRHGEAWRLAVETRAYDLLLDQVPWSYATIRFGWMDRVIYVEWRQ